MHRVRRECASAIALGARGTSTSYGFQRKSLHHDTLSNAVLTGDTLLWCRTRCRTKYIRAWKGWHSMCRPVEHEWARAYGTAARGILHARGALDVRWRVSKFFPRSIFMESQCKSHGIAVKCWKFSWDLSVKYPIYAPELFKTAPKRSVSHELEE